MAFFFSGQKMCVSIYCIVTSLHYITDKINSKTFTLTEKKKVSGRSGGGSAAVARKKYLRETRRHFDTSV